MKDRDGKYRPDWDLKFADLIRFDRWPRKRRVNDDDNELVPALDRVANNTAVHRGFACGANLQVPDKWLSLTGAMWEHPAGGLPQGWLFLNLNSPLPDYGPLGLYVATYRTGVDPTQAEHLHILYDAVPPKSLGLLYAVEATTTDPATGTPLTFDNFKTEIRRNNQYPNPLLWADFYVFRTIDNHTYDFWMRPDSFRYSPRIFKEDGQFLFSESGLAARGLADGPYLKTPGGHDGRIEIRGPSCDTPLVLDYRDSRHPVYQDNFAVCPQPWADRAKALVAFAEKLSVAERHKEGVAALKEAIAIYRRLTAVDNDTYLEAFATTVHLLVIRLLSAGAIAEVPAAAEEAIAVHRRAAAGGVDPIATATQLVTLSHHLTAHAQAADQQGDAVAGQMLHQQSVLVTRAAADILRGFQPPDQQQVRYLEAFATTVHLLVIRLLCAGAIAEVPAAAEEAIAVHRRAAAGGVDPIATATQLVTLSHHLTAHAQAADQQGDAVAGQMLHQQSVLVTRAAADILRGFQPPDQQQVRYLEAFATTVHLLVIRLLCAGAIAEVPAAAEEAIAVHRRAAAGGVDPIATATQLVTLSHHLTAHGFHDAAAKATHAAASLT